MSMISIPLSEAVPEEESAGYRNEVTPIGPRAMAVEGARGTPATGRQVRRRGSAQQGRALESLGHAVEYLLDSRLFLVENVSRNAEQDALQILMHMSRAVFMESPEVISAWQRLSGLCRRGFTRRREDRNV